MKTIVSARHLELTNEIKGAAESKIEFILSGKPLKVTKADVVFSKESSRFKVEIIISLKGHVFEADDETYDLYESLDSCSDKIEKQIARYLDKVQHHKGHPSLQEVEGILREEYDEQHSSEEDD